jgi:hypothetical protein
VNVRAWSIAAALLVSGSSASAALYEFTLEGTVTFSRSGTNPSVGDPVTIRYVADSQDIEPSTIWGTYLSRDTTIVFPHGTLVGRGPADPVLVELELFDFVGYADDVDGPGLPNEIVYIDFRFPPGSLADDSLPLTLPLPSAITSRMQIGGPNPRIFANITSYSSMLIPEPAAFGLCSLLFVWGRRI